MGQSGPAAAQQGLWTDQQTLLLELMSKLADRDEASGELGTAGKSLKRLHKMQARVSQQPRAVVQEYIDHMKEALAATDYDPWAPWQFSQKISWGRYRGLQRCHFHLSQILELQLRGQGEQAAAYTVQLLRALHQTCLDSGSWESSALFLPKQDPLLDKQKFGGTQAELETVAAYHDAIKKLQRAHSESTKGAKGGGKGKDNKKEGKEDDGFGS